MSARQQASGAAAAAAQQQLPQPPASYSTRVPKGEYQRRHANRTATNDDNSTNAASRSNSRSSSSSSDSSADLESAKRMATLKATAAEEREGPQYIAYDYSKKAKDATVANTMAKRRGSSEGAPERYDYHSKLVTTAVAEPSPAHGNNLSESSKISSVATSRANFTQNKSGSVKGPTQVRQANRRELASLVWDMLYAQIGYRKEELDNLRHDESLAPAGGNDRLLLGECDTVADSQWTEPSTLKAIRYSISEYFKALEELRGDNVVRNGRKYQTKSFVDDKRHDALRAREAELFVTSKKIASEFKKIDLSDKGLQTVSDGILDFGGVEQLILSRNKLRHLAFLPDNLRILIANGNELQTILAAPLNQPRIADHLLFVSVADNQLTSLAFVSFMPKLRVLDASFNEIHILEDATDPICDGGAPFLAEITLTGNPISLLPRYRQFFSEQAPQVLLLDGVATAIPHQPEGSVAGAGTSMNRNSQSAPTYSPSPPRGSHGAEGGSTAINNSKANQGMSAQQIQAQQLLLQQQAQQLFAQQQHQQQVHVFQHLSQQQVLPANHEEIVVQLNINKLCGLPTLSLPTYVGPPLNPDGTPMITMSAIAGLLDNGAMGSSTNVASTAFGYSTNTAAPGGAASVRGKDFSVASTVAKGAGNKSVGGPTPPKAPGGGKGGGAQSIAGGAAGATAGGGGLPGGATTDGLPPRPEAKTTFSLLGISPLFSLGNPSTSGGLVLPPTLTPSPSLAPTSSAPIVEVLGRGAGAGLQGSEVDPLLAEGSGVAVLIKDADTIAILPVDEEPAPVVPIKGKGSNANASKTGGKISPGAGTTKGSPTGAGQGNTSAGNDPMASNMSAISDGNDGSKGADEETAYNITHTISIPPELLAPDTVTQLLMPLELIVSISSHVPPQAAAPFIMGLNSPPNASPAVLSPTTTNLRSPITFTEPPAGPSIATARPSSQPQQMTSAPTTTAEGTPSPAVDEDALPLLPIPASPPATEIIGSFLIDTAALVDVTLASESTGIIGGTSTPSHPSSLSHATRYLALEDVPLTIDPLFVANLKRRIADLTACAEELIGIDKKLSVALNEMSAALSPPSSPPMGGGRTGGALSSAGGTGYASSPTAGSKPGGNSLQRRSSVTPSMLAMQQQQMAAAAAQFQNASAYQELAKAQKESAIRKAHIAEIQRRVSCDIRRLAKVNDIKVTLSGVLAINPAPMPSPDSARQLLGGDGGLYANGLGGLGAGGAGSATGAQQNKSKPPKAR